MTYPFSTAITLLSRSVTGEDSLGNDVYGSTPSVVTGAFNPGTSVELVQGQDQVITQPTVYLPAGTDVSAVDQVVVDGRLFDVDGSPNRWVNPFTGWQPGIEVKLKGVTG